MTEHEHSLVQKILINVKANGLHVSGDFYFMLLFRSEAELKKICRDMHIATEDGQ
jgi:hypothetical protein